MKKLNIYLIFLLMAASFSACKKDKQIEPESEQPKPTLENLELGLGNAGIGVINEDFHFEGDILAVDRIDKVELKFRQKAGHTYSKTWQHDIVWDQYKGLKNTNIHKHFTIPKEAAEGKYDLLVTVTDENGSKLEVKKDFEIYTRANLPIRPVITVLTIQKDYQPIYDLHSDGNKNPTEKLKKDETLTSQVTLSYVKGNGIVYVLLIKKSANHNPTTIEQIDFSKAIVYDVFEHKNEANVYDFSNVIFDMKAFKVIRSYPEMKIGIDRDNQVPTPNQISGAKAWQTGEYNLVVIYKNTTANLTIHKTIPFGIEFN